ncbi:MAG: DUF6320 domain-containing protein [Eubacteriales bacterium]|nr:DUF6320 domain-containing protein [Eubacteriales bacterium]
MSYCVNCGVELERTQKKCPLCGVKVINPMEKEAPEDKKTFPETRDELKKTERAFWFKFISIICVVPIATCVLLNLLYDSRLTWSVFVIAGVFMLWAFSTSPFYFRKFRYITMMSVDLAAVLTGLFVIESMVAGKGWFLSIALPVAVYCFVSLGIVIYLTRIKILKGLRVTSALVLSITLLIFMLEILIDLYTASAISLFWSWFVIAPCLSIVLLLFILEKNQRVREAFARRLHF